MTPSLVRRILFPRGSDLAVIAGGDKDGGGDGEKFWLCRTLQHVYEDREGPFAVQWLEKAGEKGKAAAAVRNAYRRSTKPSSLERESVLCKIKLCRANKGAKDLVLSPFQKKKVDDSLKRVDEGRARKWEEEMMTSESEEEEEEEEEGEDEEESDEGYADENGEEAKEKRSPKKAASNKVAVTATRKRKRSGPAKKSPAAKAKKDDKGRKKEVVKKEKKKTTTTKKKPEKPKGPKLKGKLKKPRPELVQWDRDPLFESKAEEVPFVSTVAHGKLLFRAVATRDLTLLKKCIADKKQIYCLDLNKSLAMEESPLDFACRTGYLPAVSLLAGKDAIGVRKKRAPPPDSLLETTGTGEYNFRSLGIRRIRRLNVSRGNREGNNAFTKDHSSIPGVVSTGARGVSAHKLVQWEVPLVFYKELDKRKALGKGDHTQLVHKAVRYGNLEVAAHYTEKDMKENRLGSSFSRYHLEALTFCAGDKWDAGSVREVSVRKKAGWYGGTPLHFACVNPCVGPLKQLFMVCPDVNMPDSRQRKPVHYAAAARGTGPLEFLVGSGANLEDIDKKGRTPLMRACRLGRVDNVRYIIEAIKEKRGGDLDSDVVRKMGPGGVNVPNRASRTAVHYAVENNQLEVLKVLHEAGANLEKALGANMEKRTPLMIAAARGYLDIVKFLTDKVKLTTQDTYKRTALTHAVMNGSAAVASYLLRLGFDAAAADSSGNTDLHYASAYGWYFCARVLVEAGANLTAANEWKLTPLAVAFLKGHTGLAKYLLSLPGVDVDFRNDAGKTTLLVLVSEANSGSGGGRKKSQVASSLLAEVKELVETRGADPKARDHDGRGALHYLCCYDTKPSNEPGEERSLFSSERDSSCTLAVFKKQWASNKDKRTKLVRFFLDKGCSTMQPDKEGYLPVMRLMERKENQMGRKDYELIEAMLEAMRRECDGSAGEYKIEEGKPGLLNAWASNVSLFHIREERRVFDLIWSVTNLIKDRFRFKITPSFESLVEARMDYPDSLTAFLQLCKCYSASGGKEFDKEEVTSKSHLYEGVKFDKEGKIVGTEEKWKEFQEILSEFRRTYDPKLLYWAVREYKDRAGVKRKGEEPHSAPVILSDSPNEPPALRGEAFRACVAAGDGSSVDEPDCEGRTPLVRAVLEGRKMQARALVEDGHANVNFYYTEDKAIVLENKEKVHQRSCPLYDAVERGNLEVVKLLLANGAELYSKQLDYKDKAGKKHRKELAHVATLACMGNRNDKDRRQVLKELVRAGANLNAVAARSRNPLHLSVNGSTDDANEALDLEVALLRGGCRVAALDKRGRLPLHYAFVKVGRHRDSGRADPIEVVSLLVEAMEEGPTEGASVDQEDEFGARPLHYAAYRGATVSCLLLLQKGADINAVDKKGNTPLAYAVMGEHEGCALVLLQKGASVNVSVHPADMVDGKKPVKYRCLQGHFDQKDTRRPYSLFQGIINNDWSGVAHVALRQFESFGLTFARAVEVAFHMQKVPFAKNLLGKQVSNKKLRDRVTNDRDLLACFAYECKKGSYKSQQADIVEIVAGENAEIQKDKNGCNALHYACMNHNYTLLGELLKMSPFAAAINAEDNDFHVSPMAALFWNSPRDEGEEDGEEAQNKCLELLLDAGADPDVLFVARQLDLTAKGYTIETRCRKDFEVLDESCPAVTPLIVAVVHLNHRAVELLLAGDKGKKRRKKADLNLCDDRSGLSPLMYAVKTNDADVVIQLLTPGGERPGTSGDASGIAKRKSDVDLHARDFDGYGVLHHLIEVSREPKTTYDNVALFKLLEKAGCRPNDDIKCARTGRTKTTGDLAEELGATAIGKALRSPVKKHLEIPQVKDCVEDWDWEMYDVQKDAEAMLKILEKKAEEEEKRASKKKTKEDAMDVDDDDEEEDDDGISLFWPGKRYGVVKDELKDKPSGCTATKDAKLYDGHTVLMQKIDVKYGAWGMYNFYRMQIWKEKHKNLWILFTNWGRIGHYGGQYQNTPFGSAEQAVSEFEKIFKAKSGNEWSADVASSFENKPGKYRLVETEHLQKVRKKELHFDLESDIPSQLPKPVRKMIADVTDVSMYVKAYEHIGSDVEAMPFGRIKREKVLEAKKLLDRLETLTKRKEAMETGLNRMRTKARLSSQSDQQKIKDKEVKLQERVEEIYALSSEYYFKLPRGGFEYTRLQVLDKTHTLEQEKARVDFVLYLSATERLLLGAQYRKEEVNPLDYIYRALGCRIVPLSPDDRRAGMIMHYMYNSSSARNKVVKAIFEVRRPQEETEFGSGLGANKTKERKLLWHGTKVSNLLSIFSSGLTVAPMHAPLTGKAFGNGIYTADIFEKSWQYAFSFMDSAQRGRDKYMLLCDVSLGRVYNFDRQSSNRRHPTSFPPQGFDSFVHNGDQVPDPLCTVRFDGGLDVPLGPIVEKERGRGGLFYWGGGHSEYVTYKDSQTSLRYLVRIRADERDSEDEDEDEDEDEEDEDEEEEEGGSSDED